MSHLLNTTLAILASILLYILFQPNQTGEIRGETLTKLEAQSTVHPARFMQVTGSRHKYYLLIANNDSLKFDPALLTGINLQDSADIQLTAYLSKAGGVVSIYKNNELIYAKNPEITRIDGVTKTIHTLMIFPLIAITLLARKINNGKKIKSDS